MEDIFRQAGVLQEFHITGGIPETFPRMLAALRARTPNLAAPVVGEAQKQAA